MGDGAQPLLLHILKCLSLFATGQSTCTSGDNLMIVLETGFYRKKIIYVSYNGHER